MDPHFHEFGLDREAKSSPDMFCGLQLRKLRRSRGLNQAQLAELLGVTQPNISRWEAGFERTPVRLKDKLRDILTGHNRHAGDYYYRVANSDPSLTAFEVKQFSLPIIKLSRDSARMLAHDPDDYVGKDYRRIFEADWLDDLFEDRPLTDYVLLHVNHELVPEEDDARIPSKRIDALLYVFQPEDGLPLLMIHGYLSPSTGEPPRLVHAITVDNI